MESRVHIRVSGVVQGVGYRAFVQRQARRLQLHGRVRNLPDGRVEIDAEGPRGLIEALIQECRTGHPWASVRDMQVDWLPREGKYDGFDITW